MTIGSSGTDIARAVLAQLRYAIEVMQGVQMDTAAEQHEFARHVERLQHAHQLGEQRLAEIDQSGGRPGYTSDLPPMA